MENIKLLLQKSSKIVIFTGAGMSTESGIADYRSQGGLWQRYQPVTLQEFIEYDEKKIEYWKRKREIFPQILQAVPHAGHRALLRLQNQNKLLGTITQNIDGLHQKSGMNAVLEIHGTNLETMCLGCGITAPFAAAYELLCKGETIPRCGTCGGYLKANTISFGQELDGSVLRKAIQWARSCDLFIAIGSSLVVEPAASLPVYAKQAGSKLIIINRESTPLDHFADYCLNGSISEILEQIVD